MEIHEDPDPNYLQELKLNRASTKEYERQSNIELQLLLRKRKKCTFGLYLRYIIWQQFSLFKALCVLVVLDSVSLVFESVVFVPIFFDSGDRLTPRLAFCVA